MLAQRLGSLTILHVDLAPAVTLVMQVEGGDTTPLHTDIILKVDPKTCHLFDRPGMTLHARRTALAS